MENCFLRHEKLLRKLQIVINVNFEICLKYRYFSTYIFLIIDTPRTNVKKGELWISFWSREDFYKYRLSRIYLTS